MRTALAFTVLSAILLLACAGARARNDALLPAMALAWPGIASDVQVAVDGGLVPSLEEALRVRAASAEMTAALAAKDLSRVRRVLWPTLLHDAALQGIDLRLSRGEVGPGVADSLRERVKNFDEAFSLLGAR